MIKTLAHKYKITNSYALRTPLFSINQLMKIYQAKSTKKALRSLFNEQLVKESIYLASPEFYKLVETLFAENSESHNAQKLYITLLKYATRLCTRPTPFGLFAGTSMGSFNESNSIVLDSVIKHSRKTRIDFSVLARLSQSLSRDTKINKDLIFYPNTTLYKTVDQFRYIKVEYIDDSKEYLLKRISPNQILFLVINFIQTGRLFSELVNFVRKQDYQQEDAVNYVHFLIDNQIIISHLEPYTVGPDYLNYLRTSTKEIKTCNHPLLKTKNKNLIEQLDRGFYNSIEKYQSLYGDYKKVLPESKEEKLFQVDVYPTTISNNLSSTLKIEISKALNVLSSLFDSYHGQDMNMFVKAFEERYETREIPLIDVLDMDYGLGYPINENKPRYSYISDMDFNSTKESIKSTITLNKTEYFLHGLLKRNQNQPIDLEQFDLTDFKITDPNLNATSYSIAEIYKIDGETNIFIDGFGGTSLTNILGRFTSGSKEIKSFVRQMAQYEEDYYKGHIVAEIAHLPENRTGNILFHPKIRTNQINFLSGTNSNQSGDIPIQDIMISCKKSQIQLRSVKHNKPIKAYLSNAHNFNNSNLPVYRFLCALQYHEFCLKIGFNWGSLTKLFTHFPRVCYGKIILSKESWVFEKSYLKQLLKSNYSDNELMKVVKNWRTKEAIPKYVQLKKSDNVLLVNLDNILSVRMLIHSLTNSGIAYITLLEWVNQNQSIVTDQQSQLYSNEFVFCLTKETPYDD